VARPWSVSVSAPTAFFVLLVVFRWAPSSWTPSPTSARTSRDRPWVGWPPPVERPW